MKPGERPSALYLLRADPHCLRKLQRPTFPSGVLQALSRIPYVRAPCPLTALRLLMLLEAPRISLMVGSSSASHSNCPAAAGLKMKMATKQTGTPNNFWGFISISVTTVSRLKSKKWKSEIARGVTYAHASRGYSKIPSCERSDDFRNY